MDPRLLPLHGLLRHLPEHRRDLRHRSRSYWEERARALGPETAGLAQKVLDADDVLQQLRKVQVIVTHLEDSGIS